MYVVGKRVVGVFMFLKKISYVYCGSIYYKKKNSNNCNVVKNYYNLTFYFSIYFKM